MRYEHALESLPHVLNHCWQYSVVWKRWHNVILEGLAATVSRRFDRAVPEVESNFRSDLIIVD